MERDRVTQPGFVLKVQGEGMPRRSFPSEYGDLYIEFSVRVDETRANDEIYVYLRMVA